MPDLSQLSESDFLKTIRGVSQVPIADDIPGLAPDTKAALLQGVDMLKPGIDPFLMSEAAKLGARRDVLFNVDEGSSMATRIGLGLDKDQLNQFKYLNEKFGTGNVEINRQGQFILRNQDVSGHVEDVLANPPGFDVGDIAEYAGDAPGMIAGAVAAKFGGAAAAKAGYGAVAKVLAASGAMGVAQEATGATEDALVRWFRDNEINMPEIAKHRAAMAVTDFALGTALAGAAKVTSKLDQGWMGLVWDKTSGDLTATIKAQQALLKRTGIERPLTPGEASENQILLRIEALARGRIGGMGAFQKVITEQKTTENELRRVFVGMPRTLTDEQLSALLPKADVTGGSVVTRLESDLAKKQANLDTIFEGEEQALANAAQKAAASVSSKIGVVQKTGAFESQSVAKVDLANPLERIPVGQAARDRVVNEFATFKSDVGKRYEAFLERPEIIDLSIDGKNLANAVKKIQTKTTPRKKTESSETTFDAFGDPIVTESVKVETMNAFVDSKVKGFIGELKALGKSQTSVASLKIIRTRISNAIKEGVAIPGTDVAQLSMLKGSVDDAITSALDGMADPTLKATWVGLNAEFKAGMERFNRVGVRDILIKQGELGAIENAELANVLSSSSPKAFDRYMTLKAFFGSSSPEFKAMQETARQDVLRGTLDDLSGYIKGSNLRNRLEGLDPDVAQELFGLSKNELHKIGEILKNVKGNLDVEELEKLALNGTLTASKLPDLIAAEKAKIAAFSAKALRGVAKGLVETGNMKPSDMVRNLSQMDPKDVSAVLGIQDADVLRDIRRVAIEHLWGKSNVGLPKNERISAMALKKTMGDEVQQRTWRVLIGDDVFEGLKELADVVSARDVGIGLSKAMGSLGGQNDLARIFAHGEVAGVPAIAIRTLLGTLYTGPLKKSITNMLLTKDAGRIMNATIISTPFIQHVLDEFGPIKGAAIMQSLRQAIEPTQKKQLFIQGKLQDGDPSKLSENEFRQWLKNNAKQ